MALGRIDRFFCRIGRTAENYPRATKALKVAAPVVTAGIAAAFDLWASFGIARDTLLISAPSAAAVTSGVGALFSWGTKQVVTRVKAEEEKIAARTETAEKEEQLADAHKRNTIMAQSLRQIGILTEGDIIPFEDGRYIYKRRLGEGGMAAAILVYDQRLDVLKVFKFPLPELATNGVELERFKSAEARSMMEINHPGVVRFWDLAEMKRAVYESMVGGKLPAEGAPEKIPFIIMEFVDAPLLDRAIWGKKLPLDQAARIAIDVAKTLSEVRKAGITHRDLKPGNIFLLLEDRTKVLDFGLAKKKEVDNKTVGIMGSPDNMSPEQWYGRADWRSDQYALGVILCEMVSGAPPFGRSKMGQEALMEYGTRVTKGDLPRAEIMGRIDLIGKSADRLWQIMSRMLAKEPDARYQSWEECISDLEYLIKTQDGPPGTPKTRIGPFLK